MRPPPFNTQDQKWSPDKNAIKNNVPGPGAYSIAGDLNKGKVIAINSDKGRISILTSLLEFENYLNNRFSYNSIWILISISVIKISNDISL